MKAEKFKQAKIKIRDTVNKLTGQDKLIEQYYSILLKLYQLSDNMTDESIKAKLQKDLDKLTESFMKTIKGKYSDSFTIESFNPYKISNRNKLKSKVVIAKKLASQYGIEH